MDEKPINSVRRLIRSITIGCLFALQLVPVVSAEVPLAAFQANYELFYGKSKVANAQINLSQSGDTWHWRLTTKPTGLLSLITNKEPLSETIFIRVGGSHQIQDIKIAKNGEKDKQMETARFDWNSKRVDMMRKGVQNIEPLSEDVYDYLSIHLLAANMMEQNIPQARVDFYYKGRLVKAELKQLGKARLELNEKEIDVMIFEQSVEGSRTKSKYYYDPDAPYIPMKIETTKPGKTTTTMFFRSQAQ
jgi:hypothetical protein